MPEPIVADQLADEPADHTIVSSELVFSGRVWNVLSDRFSYGDHEIVREYVEHPGAVAVLAIDDLDRVLLIQQYRHPIRTRDWELPAGLLDMVGEHPLETARRELAEEADLVANQWSELVSFHPSPGGNSELIRVYLATGLSAAEQVFERTEEEADIRLEWIAFDDAVAGVLDGRFRNSILMLAVLAAHARR